MKLIIASPASPTVPNPGSGETVYKKFSVRNFNWMTFTGYISAMLTSIQPDLLEVIKA